MRGVKVLKKRRWYVSERSVVVSLLCEPWLVVRWLRHSRSLSAIRRVDASDDNTLSARSDLDLRLPSYIFQDHLVFCVLHQENGRSYDSFRNGLVMQGYRKGGR